MGFLVKRQDILDCS